MNTPGFVFGAKSQLRVKVAMNLAKFYQTVRCELDHNKMRWNPIIKNFVEHWKALKNCKDDDTPNTPKITKTLPIMKWTEAFTDFIQQVIGVQMIPLSYVIRENVEVPAVLPTRANGQCYLAEHGSVEEELIA
jgi:hypothetical protein